VSSEYAGRRRAVSPKPHRQATLAGAAIPATAAAALSIVATGVGVAAGIDGTAGAAVGRHSGPDTATRTNATVSDASVSTVESLAQDAVSAVSTRQDLMDLQTSRAEQRAALALETAAAHRWVLPVAHYVLSSPFGMRWGVLHPGEDFAVPVGTQVHAISSGVIVFAGVQGGYGNKIEIRHWDGTCSWYGHLSKIEVKVGQKVGSDQVIGLSGDTGHSTGPHLHLEIHPGGKGPIDPIPWLRAHGLHP
jgi:murein DD-endopeptidase MepM/ murein hydrolase activator NlpD